jgi:hypothetical protein
MARRGTLTGQACGMNSDSSSVSLLAPQSKLPCGCLLCTAETGKCHGRNAVGGRATMQTVASNTRAFLSSLFFTAISPLLRNSSFFYIVITPGRDDTDRPRRTKIDRGGATHHSQRVSCQLYRATYWRRQTALMWLFSAEADQDWLFWTNTLAKRPLKECIQISGLAHGILTSPPRSLGAVE